MEPNEEHRSELRTALERAGYLVAEAATADQAMWRFPTHVSDVVVCSFPSFLATGESLISALKRLPPEQGGAVPILALIKPGMQLMDAPRAVGLGADGQCPRDIPPKTLAAMVRRMAGSATRRPVGNGAPAKDAARHRRGSGDGGPGSAQGD